jgi:hypothetical protein
VCCTLCALASKLPLQVNDATINDAINRGTEVPAGLAGSTDPATVGITSVLFHPTNASLAFAAIYNHGVLRSSDAGLTWEPLLCNSPVCDPPDPFPASSGAAAAASPDRSSVEDHDGQQDVTTARRSMAVQPMFVCRMALTPKTGTLLVTDRQQGVFQLQSAVTIKANTAKWQDITPRALADPYVNFCAIDAVALPSAVGSPAKERIALATCEIIDDQNGTRKLCQVFVAETIAAASRQRADTQPQPPIWRQQHQNGMAVDATWWDSYMLAGPFNTGLLLSRKPGASLNQIWLTNNFGVLRGTVTAAGSATAFRQLTRGVEEVCAFDVKVLPAATGGNVLSAVADVDGFTHKGGEMSSAPMKFCNDQRGAQGQCAYFQETHSLAYCYR